MTDWLYPNNMLYNYIMKNKPKIKDKIFSKFIDWLKLKISKYNKTTFHIDGNPINENDISINLLLN